MKKRQLFTYSKKQSLADLADKVSAKWQLLIQPNTPSRMETGTSTKQILSDLVAMPTVTGNYEANHEALDYIDRFLSERGLYVKRFERNGIESLVATTTRTKKPTVLLAGHVDVVPAPPEQFQLREKNGRYYGRGTLDMKCSIAAYLGVVRDLQDTVRNYDFGIMVTTDEEVTGGLDGAARIVEEGYRPRVVVLPDGGNNWNLEERQKGTWFITLTIAGKSAHGSRPWEGENAIDKMLTLIHEIKKLFPEVHAGTNTINVGMISAGHAINQVPAAATASLDIRACDTQNYTYLQKTISDICERHSATIKVEMNLPPVAHDKTNTYLQEYSHCTEQIIGRPAEWITSTGGNESPHFAKLGIPCAIAYPAGSGHHSAEEYIEKEALGQLQQIFHRYILSVARIPKTASDKSKK